MIISCIVATAQDNIIGKDNDIPWYLPADLKYFKKTTLNHPIMMGRKCYSSIGRPLPKRTNIIITRDAFFISSNCIVTNSIDQALQAAYDTGASEAFIIGGGMIYEQTQELWDRLYLTEVDLKVDGDVVFPKLDTTNWKLIKEEKHLADEKNEYNYTFKVLDRVTQNT